MPPRLHELQKPLDRLVYYMNDARNVYATIFRLQQQLTAVRKEGGASSGAGAPSREHKSLNRAVVVATVGAMEAFFEDVALSALEARPNLAAPAKEWYPIAGSRGMIQTPSPYNIRKLFWTYFNIDPTERWDIVTLCDGNEISAANPSSKIRKGTWRGHYLQHSKSDASAFIDAMVKVRHGFAHQDSSIKTARKAGILTVTKGGSISVHSHHAVNSMSALVQIAIITAMHLAEVLDMDSREFRWSARMSNIGNWEWLLAGTPAGDLADGYWRGAPDLAVG